MTIAFVELSGENRPLAVAEAIAAAEALGGGAAPGEPEIGGLLAVRLPSPREAEVLSTRLALARRTLALVAPGGAMATAAAREGSRGATASFRRIGRPSGGDDPEVRSLGRAYKEGGGRIDLESPERRFWVVTDASRPAALLEEVSAVDRSAVQRRRMPLLPFQRPVSLPPKLARAAANLARIRRGDRVLDPFLGTGALLAEAGLLGARLYGIDRDDEMARGALQNLEHLGVPAESLVIGDAEEASFGPSIDRFEAILTDPPYGRSSTTGGEAADHLIERVLAHWSSYLVPGGRVSVVVPAEAPRFLPEWNAVVRVRVRAHRSLTREFRVYERPPPISPGGRST